MSMDQLLWIVHQLREKYPDGQERMIADACATMAAELDELQGKSKEGGAMSHAEKPDGIVISRLEGLYKDLSNFRERLEPYLEATPDQGKAEDSTIYAPIVRTISKLEELVAELRQRLVT